jgi:hypothetical protein
LKPCKHFHPSLLFADRLLTFTANIGLGEKA